MMQNDAIGLLIILAIYITKITSAILLKSQANCISISGMNSEKYSEVELTKLG